MIQNETHLLQIKEMINQSGSVIIVSHSMGLLKSICNKIIIIEDGMIVDEGNPDLIIQYYSNLLGIQTN